MTMKVLAPGALIPDRPDGNHRAPAMRHCPAGLLDSVLDAAEAVVVRQGIANLTLESVATEAGLSKGGLLHHFPSKDKLVEGMVRRSADQWRTYWRAAVERVPAGPGRIARALLQSCMADADCWTEQLRRSSSAVFAALAQNPSLIGPMRAVYEEMYAEIARDGLPPGRGEAVVAALDGLWLYWVLGLVPVSRELVARVRGAMVDLIAAATVPARPRRPRKNRNGPRPRRATRAAARAKQRNRKS